MQFYVSSLFALFKACVWFAGTHLQNKNDELSFPEMELNPRPVLESAVTLTYCKGEDCHHLRSPLSSDIR